MPDPFDYLDNVDFDELLGEQEQSPIDYLDNADLDTALGEKAKNDEQVDPGELKLNVNLSGDTPTRTILKEAMKVDPQKALRTQKISQRTGLSEDLVEGNEDELELSMDLTDRKIDTIHRRSPKTTQFILDPQNSKIVHQDIEELEAIEELMTSPINRPDVTVWADIARNAGPRIANRFGVFVEGAELATINTTGEGRMITEALKFLPQNDPEANKIRNELIERRGEIEKPIMDEIHRLNDELELMTPEDMTLLQQGVVSGIDSLGLMGPGFTLGLITGGRLTPVLATMYAQTMAISYAEGRSEKGLDHNTALARGNLMGMIEVATEMGATGTLMKMVSRTVKTPVTRQTLRFIIQEMGSEQIATLAQTAVDYVADLDAELAAAETLEEKIAIQGERQVLTAIATVVAGGGQLGVATVVNKAVGKVADHLEKRELESNVEQQHLDRIIEQSANSKLRSEKDPEKFRQFMQKVDGNKDTQVYIDGDAVASYIEQFSQEQIDADAALTILSKQIEDAGVGAPVQIPVADFATWFAGTDHIEPLRAHMNMTPDTPSPAQQANTSKIREQLEATIKQGEQNASQYVAAQELFQNLRTQLVESGRLSPREASVSAQLLPAWAMVQSQQRGIPVEQVFRDMGFTVEGPMTERPSVVPVTEEEVQLRTQRPTERRQETAERPATEERRGVDRRQDAERRERIAAMTPEEQVAMIYRHELTGINNRRAFDEDVGDSQLVTSIDVDSLKTVNDNLGHTAGDQLLKTVANSLAQVFGPQAYHISGDEFYVLGNDRNAIESGMRQVQDLLSEEIIIGEGGRMDGVQLTHGTSLDKATADELMEQNKVTREEAGERVGRGEIPSSMTLAEDPMATDFHGFIGAAKTALGPEGAFVHQYSQAEYEEMDLFLYDEGKAGFAITNTGDIVSVFKHPDSEILGAIDVLINEAIRQGGTKLDAFEGFLTQNYTRLGFQEVERLEWDDQYSPEGWDKSQFGTPDVVLMELTDVGKQRATSEADTEQVHTPSRIRRGTRLLEQQGGQDQTVLEQSAEQGLIGLPTDIPGFTPERNQHITQVAEDYMASRGMEYNPPRVYVPVNRERAARIAQEFENMQHAPHDPTVAAAYQAMIDETVAQYEAAIAGGLTVDFINYERDGDPYAANPRMAIDDINNNNHMWVFSTRDGFGSSELDVSDNPLLAETKYTISGQPALVNDLFRVVHDYFGHAKEGVGFRAGGEENAWRIHSAMFSPLARKALTTETRGQNSWVNFGPHGEFNRTASGADTKYADQKVGLLPDWVVQEGADDGVQFFQKAEVSRNSMGFYSATAQAVLRMRLPQWTPSKKNPEGKASGAAIWQKLQKEGKRDEMEWTSVEEFLTTNPENKFTRENVVDYIIRGGVDVSENLADQNMGPEDFEFDWQTTIDDNSANWEHRVDDMMYDFDHAADAFDSDIYFIDGDQLLDKMEETLRDHVERGILTQDNAIHMVRKMDFIEAQSQDDITGQQRIEEFEPELGEVDADDVTQELFEMMQTNRVVYDFVYEKVFEVAKAEYMQDPILIYFDENTELEFAGNDSLGYRAPWFMDIRYDVFDVELEAREYAVDQGLITSEDDEFTTRWRDHLDDNTEFHNYRERKLTLPEIDGDFYNTEHFPDRNIVAFLRTTDRELPSVIKPEDTEVSISVIVVDNPIEGALHKRIVHVINEDTGDVIRTSNPDWSRYTEEQDVINEISDNIAKKDGVRVGGDLSGDYVTSGTAGKVKFKPKPGKVTTYVVDELQSDWHQSGRKHGYRDTQFETDIDTKSELQLQTRELLDEVTNLAKELGAEGGDITIAINGADPEVFSEEQINRPKVQELITDQTFISLTEELRSKRAELSEVEERLGRSGNRVPDAPFKNNAWLALGLKRALADAIDNGYTQFAWSNGKMLEERWSSSYAELYSNQYDKKMKSIVKKLTKQTPRSVDVFGDVTTEDEPGYWMVPLTPEIIDKVKAEGFPLFQQEEQVKGFYDPENSIIRLTEASDLSTFLHEFAHFMLEMERTGGGAFMSDINEWFVRNTETIVENASKEEPVTPEDVKVYVTTGTTGDTKKDAALRRETHEQFATAWEQYLMEGKSPSVELANAFRTFARWLMNVYQNIRGMLNPNLDDRMRAVFDRMLASEEQIEAASIRNSLEPLFPTEELKAKAEGVKDKAKETLRERMIREIRRTESRLWKEERAIIMDDERDRLRNEQVHRARETMKLGDVKLDHATVKQEYGEDKTDKLGRTSRRIPGRLVGMTAKGQEGVHPDEAAPLFGYNSGDQMIKDLLTAPTLEEAAGQNADQRMLEEHGNVLADENIERMADEALQNEEKVDMIMAELRSLRTQRGQPNVQRQLIQDIARDKIQELSFREIHPEKYRRAEIQEAQAAAVAVAAGDHATAEFHKTRQLMNHFLAREAQDAKNHTMKVVDQMSRFNKKSNRERIARADGDYLGQIDKILERFEFRKSKSIKSVDTKNENLVKWAETRMKDHGENVVLSPAVLDTGYFTHWKNVTFGDLVGIDESLRNLEHVAKFADNIQVAEDNIAFTALVDKWTDHIGKQPKVYKPQRTTAVENKSWLRSAVAQHSKMPWVATWLDGGERVGLSHDIIMAGVNRANAEKMDLIEKVMNPVTKALSDWAVNNKQRSVKRIHIPEIQDDHLGGDNDGVLYGSQIIAVALNTGNQSNLRKMLIGEGWMEADEEASFDNPQLQAVLDHMTKEDWELVQMIWDKMDELYPQLAEVYRRSSGLAPPKIQPTPVITQHGVFNGGYYPVVYDQDRSVIGERQAEARDAEVEGMFATMVSSQSSVTSSATQERTGAVGPIRLSLDVIPNHFQDTIHYITHHEPVRQLNKLFSNKQVADSIKGALSPEEFAEFKPWLRDVAADGRESRVKKSWENVFQRLRLGATVGIMGFKASTGLIQIAGLSNAASELGGRHVFRALQTIVGSREKMVNAWGFAVENSSVMKNRAQTMDREILNAMKKIKGEHTFLAATQEMSMKHIMLIQTYMVDLPTWHAAYSKGIEDWGDHKRAVKFADFVVENTQGSGNVKDMSTSMRDKHEAWRMMTMFMTYFSALFNMNRDTVRGARSGRYSVSATAAKAMYLLMVPNMIEMLFRGELTDEDEDDEASDLSKLMLKTALTPMATVPVLNAFSSAAFGDFGYNISPIAQILNKGATSTSAFVDYALTDEDRGLTKGQAKAASQFLGAAVGVPGVNQAWATGEHLYDVIEDGEELTLNQLLFGPRR